MSRFTVLRRGRRWGAVASALCVVACAPGVRPGGQITPRAGRVSDGVIAHDLAELDRLAAPVEAMAGESPARRYMRERTRAMAGLARDAYERNDDGGLIDLLLAQREIAAPRRVPRTRRADLWALLDSAAAAPALVAARSGDVVALEVALLRAQYDVLGAPRCDAWEAEAVRLAALVRAPMILAAAPPARPAPPVPPAPVAPASPVVAPPAPSVVPVVRELRGVPSRVHFALDKSDLSAATRRVLDVVVDSLRAFPTVRLVLEGNTDQRGSVEYNAALSKRRAASVMAYLQTKGLAADRVSIRALGKSQLLTSVEDPREFARNRRVQLRYFTPDGRELPVVNQIDDLQVEGRRPR
jgi:outer membrane protein OmpA-like peptidoglycan-associated protein